MPSRRPSRRHVLGTLGACAVISARPAAAQFRVEIAGVGATQVPIVVGDFRNESASGTAIAAIVRADLARSGLFRSSNSPEALDERSSIVAADWRARGVDAVVGGSVARLADGRFDVRYKLWDAVRGEELLGRSQIVVAADLRLAAHRVADEIYESLLGEPGVFATRIAYVLRSGPRHTLFVTDADGERPQVALASAEPIISPAWSPDGRELAYVSFESQKAVVWVQNLGSGARRQIANFRGSNSAPAWSPDGRELVVTLSTTGIAQLYVMPREGGSPRRLTSSSAIDTEATYSPDGRYVYFVSDRGGSPQIYRVAATGGSAERMTFTGSQNISPALSPDGRLMTYVTRQAGGAYKVALMDLAAGGGTRLLTESSDDESPSFAPNGRLIVYATRERGRDALMTTTLDGKIKTRLVSTGADMLEPAWGPFNR
ncbi:MAG: Tol-Pal system beta propeller repeat protein TolB [Burkholderiales bacterium]|nr:Tol-Pal system beta propeller repeat protein TolB [Burkholderiales bacterium]